MIMLLQCGENTLAVEETSSRSIKDINTKNLVYIKDNKIYCNKSMIHNFLYLFHKNFPTDRIFINSAYANDSFFKDCERIFNAAGLPVPPCTDKGSKMLSELICEKKID